MAKKFKVYEEQISTVGYWEASEWGASITSYELIEQENVFNPIVRYYAIEHGERFYFDIEFHEVFKKFKDLQKHGCC